MSESAKKDPVHQLGLDRFKLAVSVWRDQRAQELEALTFQSVKNGMWPAEVVTARAGSPQSAGQPAVPARPMLSIRSLDQPIAQIVNQARQSELAVHVAPRGSDASQEIADVYEGLIRKIQNDSHAQNAYLWAYQRMVACGFGCFRINKRLDPGGDGTDQEITIERILNQASVYLDPYAQDAEWRDGEWAFVTEDIPERRYKAKYKDTKLARAEDATFVGPGNELNEWVVGEGDNRCFRIAEYWWIEGEDADRRVMWAKMNGLEWIDPPQEWDGPDIPLVPVLGNEYNVNGKRAFEGVVTPSMDSCRMLNYAMTSVGEQIGLTTGPKWVGYAGQFEGFDGWDQANSRNLTKLEAHAVTDATGSQILPLPRLDLPEAPIQAMTGFISLLINSIRSTTGVPDAALGHVNPADKSGKAIQALQHAAEQGTSNLLDNLARSIKRGGEIGVGLVPKVYDRPGRVVHLLAPDGKQDTVMLSTPFHKGPDGPQEAQGPLPDGTEPTVIDLAQGQYAVVVEVSKQESTRREATRDALLQFAQIAPELVPRYADLLAKAMDNPEGAAIAERVKPPGVDDPSHLPPAIQQQMAQMHGELEQAKQIIATKQAEKQVDLEIARMNNESRERIAAMTNQASLIATEAKIASSDTQALLKAEFTRLAAVLKEDMATVRQAFEHDQAGTIEAHKAAHQAGMMAETQAHAKMLQDQQQTHEAEMGLQGHQQALEQGEQGQAHALEQGQQAADLAPEPASHAMTPQERREAYDERAAIMEYDGGLTRVEANRQAWMAPLGTELPLAIRGSSAHTHTATVKCPKR